MATIIKRGTVEQSPTGEQVRPIAFNFQEMAGQADAYIANVRKEAAKIVQQAHTEAEKVRQNAEKAGRLAAEEAIERILDEKIAKQIQTLRPALAEVAKQLSDERGKWMDQWQRGAVRLATRMAEKILKYELECKPDASKEIIREALELAAGAADVTVRLSPYDYKHLRGETESIAESLKELAPTKIVSDDTVSRGGCIVTTQFGEIDQRIETQLARLEEELTG